MQVMQEDTKSRETVYGITSSLSS